MSNTHTQDYRAAQSDGRIAEERRREALNALQEAQRRGDSAAVIARLAEYTAAVRGAVNALLAIHAAFAAGVKSQCVKTCARCGSVKTPDKRGRHICRTCGQAHTAHICALAAAAKIALRPAEIVEITETIEIVPVVVKIAPVVVAFCKKRRASVKNTDTTCPRCGQGKTLNVAGQLICRECKRANAARPRSGRLAAARAAAKHESKALSSQKGPTAIEIFDRVCETHGLGASIPRMNPNAGRLRAGESLYPRREVAA